MTLLTLTNGRFGLVLANFGRRRNPFYLTAFMSDPIKRLSILGLPAKLVNNQTFYSYTAERNFISEHELRANVAGVELTVIGVLDDPSTYNKIGRALQTLDSYDSLVTSVSRAFNQWPSWRPPINLVSKARQPPTLPRRQRKRAPPLSVSPGTPPPSVAAVGPPVTPPSCRNCSLSSNGSIVCDRCPNYGNSFIVRSSSTSDRETDSTCSSV